MRRTAVASLVVLLLLGISGCAGVQQRVSWSSPSMDRSDATGAPAPSRFSWWRRPRAEAPTNDSTSNLAKADEATEAAAAPKLPVDVWPESRSEWLARQFPLMSRLWNGNATARTRDAEASLRSDLGRDSAHSRPAAEPGTGRADDDVRPVDASTDEDLSSSSRPAARGQREPDVPAALPIPLRVTFRPQALPESSPDDELDDSDSQPSPPAQVSPAPTLQPPSPTLPPALAPGDEQPAMDPSQPETPSARMVEETKTGTGEEANCQLAGAPSSPMAPKQEAPQPSPPPVTTAPPPVIVQTQALPPASVQPVVSGSSQAIYASPPPVAPPQPRRKFLSLFFVEAEPAPLPSPQAPPATLAPIHHVHSWQTSQVLPAPQANAATPCVAIAAAKKPCVLSVLFEKLKSCGAGFHSTGCHHAGSAPCCQGCTCHVAMNRSVCASPQGSLASPQGKLACPHGSPASQVVPIRSTGTEPGDVAQEGKLFERVTFEGLNKSPQG
jgi:hypothetical protein